MRIRQQASASRLGTKWLTARRLLIGVSVATNKRWPNGDSKRKKSNWRQVAFPLQRLGSIELASALQWMQEIEKDGEIDAFWGHVSVDVPCLVLVVPSRWKSSVNVWMRRWWDGNCARNWPRCCQVEYGYVFFGKEALSILHKKTHEYMEALEAKQLLVGSGVAKASLVSKYLFIFGHPTHLTPKFLPSWFT